jgi:nucleoid DNA-binding protein
MGVRYVILAKRNPQEPQEPRKFYLGARALGHISREQLLEEMVKNTSLTRMEAMTALNYLFEAIPLFLELGMTVQLGELGYFKVTIQSEGSDIIEEATPDKIERKCLKFVPGREIREKVNSFSVEKWPEQ